MRRALEIDEKSFGPRHPKVASRLSNLADLLQIENRLAEAEPLIRRALEIDEKSFGPQHPNVAIRLNNLAALLKATNRLAEALAILLEIKRRSGHEHPNQDSVSTNYRGLLKQMGKSDAQIDAAIEALKRSPE